MEGQGMTLEEVLGILNDTDVRYTISPGEHHEVRRHMATVRSIKLRPARWQDLFFPEVDDEPG
jgi:hypothetical protein